MKLSLALLSPSRIAALTLTVSLSFALAAPPPQPPPHRLYWDNHESLPGTLLAAAPGNITWRSDLFAQPVQLGLGPLLLITGSATERPLKLDPGADFKIVLTNGDCLYADILSSSPAGLAVRSARHGDITLPFASVHRLTRVRGGTAVYAGPRGIEGWPDKDWEIGVGGSLTTYACYRSGKLELKLPERLALDLTLSSTARLQFAFRLYSDRVAIAELSLWDGFLVLTAADGPRFTPLLTLRPDEHRLSLRVLVDRTTRKTTVLDATGRILGGSPPEDLDATFASAEKPAAKTSPEMPSEGVFLINDSKDLTLERLVVRPWNGKPQPVLAATASYAQLADGSRPEGSLKAGHAANEIAAKATAPFPIAQLEEYESPAADTAPASPFTDAPTQPPATDIPPPPSHLQWLDGTQLTGDIQRIADGQVELRSPLFTQLITAPLAELTRIVFNKNGKLPPATEASKLEDSKVVADNNDPFAAEPSPEPAATAPPDHAPAFARLDLLKTSALSIHGTLEGDGSASPCWRLLGATQATALRRETMAELLITRPRPALETPAAHTALFFLTDDSILAGTLGSIDDSGINVSSPLTPQLTQLAHEQLHAVHLIHSNQPALENGFTDSGWSLIESGTGDEFHPTPSSITLLPDCAYGHSSLMAGGDLAFTLKAEEGYGSITIAMFCADLADTHDAFVFNINCSNNQVTAQLADPRNSSSQRTLRDLPDPAVRIRLAFTESNCQLYANDKILLDVPVPIEKKLGHGLVFASANLWGNAARPMTLSNLSQNPHSSVLRLITLPAKAKQEALTIPRFRRDLIPTHALIASNGDVLRGHIDAATAARVKFTSGLDTSTIPSDRIAAAVWLQKPGPSPSVSIVLNKNGKLPPATENSKPQDSKVAADNNDAFAADAFAAESPPDQQAASQPPAAPSNTPASTLYARLHNNARFAVTVESITATHILGSTDFLGSSRIPLAEVAALQYTPLPRSPAQLAYGGWQLEYAAEPVLPETGGAPSPLLGKAAPDFTLDQLEGGPFILGKERGHLVILDFWATWCGPCIASLPELQKTAASFDPSQVKFIGVNQGEPAAQVKKFLQQRNWKLRVALDTEQTVGAKYGVEGIPHTVLIGPDGKIAWTATGFHNGEPAELAQAIRKLLPAK